MKTRCFDHIDLRVTNMETAGEFYGKILPQLGFVHESPGDDYYTFYAGGGERPLEFFCLTIIRDRRVGHGITPGAICTSACASTAWARR